MVKEREQQKKNRIHLYWLNSALFLCFSMYNVLNVSWNRSSKRIKTGSRMLLYSKMPKTGIYTARTFHSADAAVCDCTCLRFFFNPTIDLNPFYLWSDDKEMYSHRNRLPKKTQTKDQNSSSRSIRLNVLPEFFDSPITTKAVVIIVLAVDTIVRWTKELCIRRSPHFIISNIMKT